MAWAFLLSAACIPGLARSAASQQDSGLGCLAALYPREAWPRLRVFGDAEEIFLKSCDYLGHSQTDCSEAASTPFKRFRKRMADKIFPDETLCDDMTAAFSKILSTAKVVPDALVEKMKAAQDEDALAFLTRSKGCVAAHGCTLPAEATAAAPPQEAAEWCPALASWLHLEKRFGPEGYHVVCVQEVPKDEKSERKKRKLSAWIFRNASTAGQRVEISTSLKWNAFRTELQHRLAFQPSSRWEMHPWQLFDASGRLLTNVQEAMRSQLLLVFEGGEFQYPAVHIGFVRKVDIGLPAGPLVLRTVALRPAAFLVEGFLSAEDTVALKSMAKPWMSSSKVKQMDGQDGLYSERVRSSSSAFLPAEEALVQTMLNHSRSLLRLQGRQEGVQVLQYQQGQQYQAHWDYFDPEHFRRQFEMIGKLTFRRNRISTLFFYLNDVARGGATAFPMAYGAERPLDPADCTHWLQVPAKSGQALLFYNLHADARLDLSSNHAGCRVEEGEKWSANVWAWNSHSDASHDPEFDDEL